MIETENLSRFFGSIRAVDDITFSVGKGEVLGFLGPNGAGKSTTMKMLTCFLTPSSGTARVGGYDILSKPQEAQKQLGYLPENAPLYAEMEVISFLKFVAEVKGVNAEKGHEEIARVMELANLQGVKSQRIHTLSKGFKRRVGLAQALLGDPEILILDEPTDGLDPNQKYEVRKLIHEMASSKCIILSTHILEEVEEVCSRVIIISEGKLVVDSTPSELKKRSPSYGTISLQLSKQSSSGIVPELKKLTSVREVKQEVCGAKLQLSIYPEDQPAALGDLVRIASERHWDFEGLRIEDGKLDEVFREITG